MFSLWTVLYKRRFDDVVFCFMTLFSMTMFGIVMKYSRKNEFSYENICEKIFRCIHYRIYSLAKQHNFWLQCRNNRIV